MGGIAKGQIVREIDALGGYSGIITDKSTIQFRMLNLSKGPAMWSPRTQNDRMLFSQYWREKLEQTLNVDFWQDMVREIIVEAGQACGVITGMGQRIESNAVVLTNGTFLNGIIHIGSKQFGGGRIGEKAATGITEQLINLGFESGRMKTGTPPRVDGRSFKLRQNGTPGRGPKTPASSLIQKKLQPYKINVVAGSLIRMRLYMKLYAQALTSHPCMPAEFRD